MASAKSEVSGGDLYSRPLSPKSLPASSLTFLPLVDLRPVGGWRTLLPMTNSAFFPATGMPDDDWWHTLWPNPKDVLAKTGIVPGLSVIDLCCGNGHFTVPLVSLVGSSGRVIAVDIDTDMLNAARQVLERTLDQASVAICQWIVSDASKIDQVLQQKDAADAVLMANTFHGVPDQTALSRSISRVLKPGGLFIIVNWHAMAREKTTVLDQARGPKTEMRMTPQSVESVVVVAGFALQKIIELPPYHYAAVFQVASDDTTA